MKASIDFDESIRKKRLVYQGSTRQRFWIAFGEILPALLALIITLTLPILAWLYGPPKLVPFASIPVLLVVISIFLHNRLARVPRKDGITDKNEIIRHLLRKHPGIIRHNCSDQIIIITDTSRLVMFKKMYLILQDDSSVYMHLSLNAQGKLKYLIFPIPLYFMSHAILQSFANRMASSKT